jgi:imidazolonepropionase-like amidohydrolase
VEVAGAEEAAAAVATLAGSDPSAVKVALNAQAGPTLTDAELLAIVEEAHRRSLTVVAHVQGPGQTQRAAGAGVDELAHTPWTEHLSDDLIGALSRSTTMVSTLDIHSHGRGTPELRTAVDNLRRFQLAGGRVRYGTDLGNGPIPPGIHAGEALHLAAAGLSPNQILVSMTLHGVDAGAPADLVGLGANPLEDLGALRRPRLVIRDGRVRHLDR